MSASHPSRAHLIRDSQNTDKPYKKRKHNPNALPGSSTLSRSQLRKRIRDTERLLSKESKSNVTAGSRADHERALAAYKYELRNAEEGDKRKKNEKKYHMVKFFERRKATRRIHTLERLIAEQLNPSTQAIHPSPPAPPSPSSSPSSPSPSSSSQEHQPHRSLSNLEAALHSARVDLAYIIHYPSDEKYISLYVNPTTTPPTSSSPSKTDAKKQQIRHDIEQRMLTGTLGDKSQTQRQQQRHTRQDTDGDDEMDFDNDNAKDTTIHNPRNSSAKTVNGLQDGKKDKKMKDGNTKNSKNTAKHHHDEQDEPKVQGGNANGDDDDSDGGFFEY